MLAITFVANAQSTFSNTVELQNVSKKELFKRVVYWISIQFKSANDVIQLKDEEGGKIIAKGLIPYTGDAYKPGTCFTGYFSFTMEFDCKDDKYRYKIFGINHKSDNNPNCHCYDMDNVPKIKEKKCKMVKQGMNVKFSSLIENFEESMKTINDSKDDW